MFFFIGDECPLLANIHDGLCLDEGWDYQRVRNTQVWFKGYSTECVLRDNLRAILTGYRPKGIWCLISYDGEYKVHHPEMRSFPLYTLNDNITNLALDGYQVQYAPLLSGDRSEVRTLEQTKEFITQRLIDSTTEFKKYNDTPMHIWCSGGADSTALLSVLEYTETPYSIYVAEPRETWESIMQFEGTFKEYDNDFVQFTRNSYWGYEILSAIEKPMTMTTGYYGDEYLVRGPSQMNTLANALGKHVYDMIKPEDYMYSYIHKPKHNLKDAPIRDISVSEAKQEIISFLSNDYQMWHRDHTITFCPYYDADIINAVLMMDPTTIIESASDISIQRHVIDYCKPSVAQLLDVAKNSSDGKKNFVAHINDVGLEYCKEIIKV